MKDVWHGELLPYSDRKLERVTRTAWTIEDIVLAQRMACEGKRLDEIAERLGRDISDVQRMVDPDPPKAADRRRQTTAGVGHAKVKLGW